MTLKSWTGQLCIDDLLAGIGAFSLLPYLQDRCSCCSTPSPQKESQAIQRPICSSNNRTWSDPATAPPPPTINTVSAQPHLPMTSSTPLVVLPQVVAQAPWPSPSHPYL
jgi:hypothetical protein